MGADHVFPEFHSKDRMLIDIVQLVMEEDSFESSVAMNQETTNPDIQHDAIFSEITYL